MNVGLTADMTTSNVQLTADAATDTVGDIASQLANNDVKFTFDVTPDSIGLAVMMM